jgi:cyclopropane-fatty-acyl-phospholipid synthase
MLRARLERLIQIGRLTVVWPQGGLSTFGDPSGQGPDVAIRLKNNWTALKIAAHPYLNIGEAFVAGDLLMERGSVWDLLDLAGRNLALREEKPTGAFDRLARPLSVRRQQTNSPRISRRNVERHYDFSERLYRSFLDSDLQYSCGYFLVARGDPRRGAAGQEDAHRRKALHAAASTGGIGPI